MKTEILKLLKLKKNLFIACTLIAIGCGTLELLLGKDDMKINSIHIGVVI